jgi:hypothetical protein
MKEFDEQVLEVEIAMAIKSAWLAKRDKFRKKHRGTNILFTEKLPIDCTEVFKRESEAKKALQERTPEEWLERIEELPNPLKTRAAWICWWDFFSYREVPNRWHHLDHLINAKCDPVTDGDLAVALNILGYSPYMATARVKGGDEPAEEETQTAPMEEQESVEA